MALPKATHTGLLKIGNTSIPCAVLESATARDCATDVAKINERKDSQMQECY